MRFLVLGLALTFSTFGFCQSSGNGPGAYADPFAPVISTPVINSVTPPLEVGARNATFGNVAGASSFTAAPESTNKLDALVSSLFTSSPGEAVPAPAKAAAAKGFNTGASMPQSAFGTAQLAGGRSPIKTAVRTFTNADVEKK